MDAKLLAGLFLCLCFMASISISQSASARLDSRLRYRRQDEDNDQGSDDNASTAQSNTDATGAATAVGEDGTTVVLPAETAATAADDLTTASGDAAATAEAATAGSAGDETTAGAGAADATTAADGATADAATAADGTAADAVTAADGVTADAATAADGATTDSATAADGAHEASTAGATDAGSDGMTSAEPGNGHHTEATEHASGATTVADEATSAAAATAESVTGNDGTTGDHDAGTTAAGVTGDGASTEAVTADGVTAAEGATTEAHDGTKADESIATTLGPADDNGGSTQHVDDAETTAPAPVQPGPGERVELRVVVSPDVIQVQRGQTVDLSCSVYGGDSTTNIYWIQEEPERRYAQLDAPSDNDKLVTASQVILRARITLDDASKIGKYTCMAQDASGNSGSAMLTMESGSSGYNPPAVYPVGPSPSGGRGQLRISAPDMTDGDYVEITCEGAAAEDESRIQWYFNNRLLNDEQPLYPRGKTLHIRPISRPYLGNYRCSIPNSGYTDANSVLTFAGSAPPTSPPYQPVQPVQPTYGQCNADEATCRNGRCIPRAFLCDGKNDCGDNSDESCGPPDGSGTDVCQPNEIRCSTSNRGRKCVQKFWMCDGDRDCDDGSDEEQRYCELLPRQAFCQSSQFQCAGANGTNGSPVCVPRSFQCDGYNDCPDRSDEIGCVKPTIVSPPQRQIQINAGQTLTIQCTARGSPAPYINWRLNWGHICGDGYDNGRCTMVQSLDARDPTLVTGTLTVRNVNAKDGGAYSCEALNNQGFIFAIPDAIVNVIIDQYPAPSSACRCNGHSTSCASDGRCLNCQHNTVGFNCEYCASGYQGDASRGTQSDCQLIPNVSGGRCEPSGTYMERAGRCICKYNVEGDRCDQCKRSHFYLNPTTPNGCLSCFCSGVSSDCRSTEWRRQAASLSLNNWNAVPKNFATDTFEARSSIQQRNGGREIALDQSSLGRPNNEVLYWKAPKEVLGDFVTLYDGNIDIHFTNDGSGSDASNDEFIWLRGNNIDLVHKIPKTQQLEANKESTYSVPVNERTFTRKDGTHIDRENILMALSDLDTLLIKINPLGGRRNAVLRGVTFNPATRDGSADSAPTVESCRCPANYTGASCEKCAEGYGRPHPLVGIYLGQCWACRSLCHERSEQCDRETGKCSNCQGNSEGDRCERCRAGYVLDSRSHQCVPDGQSLPIPSPPSSGGRPASFYINDRPYDPQSTTPLSVSLDGSRSEQRVPLQFLTFQPQSVVWGRTDGTALPPNVVQEGNDLVFRSPSAEQAGNYICTVTHPDGYVEHISIYLDYLPASSSSYGRFPVFSPASPLSISEGSNQFIQPPSEYYQAQWTRADNQPFPSGIQQSGNGLQIVNARPDHSGTYYCQLQGADGTPIQVPYEIHVQSSARPHPSGAPPRVVIRPQNINLVEGQRMIVKYSVASHDPIEVSWTKLTDNGYVPIPSLFTVEPNSLVLNGATLDSAGTYRVTVRNIHGEEQQDLTINVRPRRTRQRVAPQITFEQDQYQLGYGENVEIRPNIVGTSGATIVWSKDGSTSLPAGVSARSDGSLYIQGQSSDAAGQYTLDVTNSQGRASRTIYISWKESSNDQGDQSSDIERAQDYVNVRLLSREERGQHQIGQDVHLDCSVHGTVERPYEFVFTKDGQPLQNNVEVHPNGQIIIRNAQQSDSGRYQCEVTFPNAAYLGTQQSYFDVSFSDGSAGGYEQSNQQGGEYAQQSGYVQVVVEPSEVNIARGEKSTIKCQVTGTDNYKVTWDKYAHDTSLPSYARQEGNNLILEPTSDSPAEQMYLRCQVEVSGQAQPNLAYVMVNVRGGDESSKKKKKRRS